MRRKCGPERLPDRCQRCVFWDAMIWQRTTADIYTHASCVALPPSLSSNGYSPKWPDVESGHYCGGFKPVEVEGKVSE